MQGETSLRRFWVLMGIIAAIFTFVLWFVWYNVSQNTLSPTKISVSRSLPSPITTIPPSAKRFVLAAPLSKPASRLVEEFSPLFEPFLPAGEEQQPATLFKTPTEEEIFEWIWPPPYRDELASLEQFLIDRGLIAPREPTDFTKEKHIYAFLETILEVSIKEGWVPANNAEGLRKGLRETLPVIIEKDKATLRAGLIPLSFLPKDRPWKLSSLRGFFESLVLVLAANEAKASPGWVTSPDCYKDDNPVNILPGPNLWAICCNCGFKCNASGCTYVDDCGANSTRCTTPLGCLNFTCKGSFNAIWDPFTGICGCG